MKKGIERCESPLETELAHAFSRQSRWRWRREDDAEIEVGVWPGWWIALLSQFEIENYRCDFVLASTILEDPERGEPWFVAVEVDGHDFHERTKEQAEHDRSRDRRLAALGVQTLRFTGREVWRDPDACANEALWYALRLQQRIVGDKFTEWLLKAAEREGR